MLTVSDNKGFAKLDTFQFSTDVTDANIFIDYGDGQTDRLNGVQTFEHQYENFGIYTVKLRRCNEQVPFLDNCLTVFVEPFTKNAIELIDPPLSSFTSFDSGLYSVCLSSNCPPPLRVQLSLSGTQFPHISEYPDDYKLGCKPKYYFKDIDGQILDGDIIQFDDPSQIFVNDEPCGYRDFGQFSFYSDDEGDLQVCAELLNDCTGCLDLTVDYDVCPVSGIEYYYGSNGDIDMIDVDIF